jgi:hypothetical protein
MGPGSAAHHAVKNGVLRCVRGTELSPMPNDIPWWRRPGVHLRHDAHRWIRHDAARFVRPGFDPADVFPTLARKAQGVQAPTFDDEFAAGIAAVRRDLRAMQDALNEVRAELARWRALDAKYSPTQPRVPAGDPRGGQWTDRNGGRGIGQVIGQDAAQGDPASLTQPMGNVDIGDVSGSSELGDLFNIRPADNRIDGVQLAGDLPENPKAPLNDPPPKIPQEEPATREGRMGFVRGAAQWVARNISRYAPAVDVFFGALDQVEKIKALTDAIKSANDPAKTLEELQEPIGTDSQGGYHDHHIVGQHAQNREQFGDSRIDSRENKVRIPVLKHIDISAWYSKGNDDFGGLSPRDYLRGKDWDEQMRVGLDRLREHKVLK